VSDWAMIAMKCFSQAVCGGNDEIWTWNISNAVFSSCPTEIVLWIWLACSASQWWDCRHSWVSSEWEKNTWLQASASYSGTLIAYSLGLGTMSHSYLISSVQLRVWLVDSKNAKGRFQSNIQWRTPEVAILVVPTLCALRTFVNVE
jgi:hypothetical protein